MCHPNEGLLLLSGRGQVVPQWFLRGVLGKPVGGAHEVAEIRVTVGLLAFESEKTEGEGEVVARGWEGVNLKT